MSTRLTLNSIRKSIEDHVGEKVKLRANGGRKRFWKMKEY